VRRRFAAEVGASAAAAPPTANFPRGVAAAAAAPPNCPPRSRDLSRELSAPPAPLPRDLCAPTSRAAAGVHAAPLAAASPRRRHRTVQSVSLRVWVVVRRRRPSQAGFRAIERRRRRRRRRRAEWRRARSRARSPRLARRGSGFPCAAPAREAARARPRATAATPHRAAASRRRIAPRRRIRLALLATEHSRSRRQRAAARLTARGERRRRHPSPASCAAIRRRRNSPLATTARGGDGGLQRAAAPARLPAPPLPQTARRHSPASRQGGGNLGGGYKCVCLYMCGCGRCPAPAAEVAPASVQSNPGMRAESQWVVRQAHSATYNTRFA